MATMLMNVWLSLATMILATMHGIPATANREHKVHNIVLYPNKQSWCTTRNISQVITEPGCKQVTIDNNVCVGACFSYSIPHTEPSDPGEIIGPYCDSCQPSDVSYVFVKVDCTENANMKNPYLYKQVQLIHNCTCTACEEQSTHRSSTPSTNTRDIADGSSEHLQGSGEQLHHHQPPLVLDKDQDMISGEHHHQPHGVPAHQKHTATGGIAGSEETPADSDMIQDDIPEILEVVHYSENDTEPIRHTPVHDLQSPNSGTTYMEQQQLNHYEHNSHTDNVKKLLHQKIVKLLRSVEETNSQSDREQLIEMIRLIKGTSDRNWDELVESLQSENSILDFNRLRTELVEDEPLNVPAFPGTDSDAVDESGKIQADHDRVESQKKHSSTPEYADHQRLMQHQYDTLRHRQNHEHGSAGSKEAAAEVEKTSQEVHTPAEAAVPARAHHHAHHHHMVGERIDAHHHLARGPHGALVIQADRNDMEIHRSIQNGHEITEKIHIQAHELKPNHAGTVVTYDGHVPVPAVTSDVGSLKATETEAREHHFQTPHMHPRQHPQTQGHGAHHNAVRVHGQHEGDRHGHHPHDHPNADHGHHGSHQAKPHGAASSGGDAEQ
uniref:CTCK domain-containing protein n=1 Tax=Anopheles culicifacies TaxID=139723 RepID=A0A182MNT4_9DIPT